MNRDDPAYAPDTAGAAPFLGRSVLLFMDRGLLSEGFRAFRQSVFIRVQPWLLTAFLFFAAGLAMPAAEKAVVRVVSQTVGTDELLLALAEPGQIAALSHLAREPLFSAVSEQAKAFPVLERNQDAESILMYEPSLVLFADYSRAELVNQVTRAGVKVLIIDRYESLEDAYNNMRLIGRELGGEERAERLIEACKERVTTLKQRLEKVQPVRVIAPSTYGVIGGAGTTFQDLCDHAGAINLAATEGGLVGHQAPPVERMLTWPIDAVVVAGDDARSALAPYKTLTPYKYLEAVQKDRAVLLKPYQLSSVTHYRIDGYEQLARALHPEVFE